MTNLYLPRLSHLFQAFTIMLYIQCMHIYIYIKIYKYIHIYSIVYATKIKGRTALIVLCAWFEIEKGHKRIPYGAN